MFVGQGPNLLNVWPDFLGMCEKTLSHQVDHTGTVIPLP